MVRLDECLNICMMIKCAAAGTTLFGGATKSQPWKKSELINDSEVKFNDFGVKGSQASVEM